MTSKEFFPRQIWEEIGDFIGGIKPLDLIFTQDGVPATEVPQICTELERMFLLISKDIQASQEWVPVSDAVTFQNKVEVAFTPTGMKKSVVVLVDMEARAIGVEEKLIGKSSQSMPGVINFTAKILPVSHPLFFISGRDFSGMVCVQKVLKPPFKAPKFKCQGPEDLVRQLVNMMRSMPFPIAEFVLEGLAAMPAADLHVRKVQNRCIEFLRNYSVIPDKIKNLALHKITDMGQHYDPELELAFYTSLLDMHAGAGKLEPQVFAQYIEEIIGGLVRDAIMDILGQMEKQQRHIHVEIESYSTIEQDKQRYNELLKDYQLQKNLSRSEEVMRRDKQEIQKLHAKISKVQMRYETDKGIILCQEMYLSYLTKSEKYRNYMPEDKSVLKNLKAMVKANHVTISKEIEAMAASLGDGARNFMIQHAIYSEQEPDAAMEVLLDKIDSYESGAIQMVMNLLPTLKAGMKTGTMDSKELLRLAMQTVLPKDEQVAFERYIEENSNPQNNVVQRFTQQLGQFLNLTAIGRGPEALKSVIKRELDVLKAVLTFATEQKKLSTDFKNHISYYRKLFIDPYLMLLEDLDSIAAGAFNVQYSRLKNSFSSQFVLKYTIAEEKALLSMFKHISTQMQIDNLFTARVFSKQIKNFMTILSAHKSSISADLMKRILETYTVYMMGCSRMQQLSDVKAGIDNDIINQVRSKREDLTKGS